MTEVYFFLHIPKTAGTTFDSVLHQVFDPADVCPPYDYPELLRIPRADLSNYRLFRGHFYYFFERLLPARPTFLTLLRDPVERTLSLYHHICRDPSHFQHHAMCSLRRGLADAVRSPELLPPNFQVTALACDLDPVGTMDAARAAHPEGFDERSVIYGKMTKCLPTRDDLASACRRLEEMKFVGIAERFDDSVRLLCSAFGWTVPGYVSLNVAPARTRRDQIPPDVLDALMRAHELDYELYEFAKSLFAKRLSRMKVTPTAD